MFAKSSKKTATFTSVDDVPTVRAAIDSLNAVKQRLTADQLECAAARAVEAENTIDAAARALLESGGVAVATRETKAARDARSDVAFQRQSDLRRAIELGNRRIAERRFEASRAIATEARPEYEQIVKRLSAALQALGEVATEEAAFRERLRDAGVEFTSVISAVPLEWARLDVYASRANLWFNEAEREYAIRPPAERRTSP